MLSLPLNYTYTYQCYAPLPQVRGKVGFAFLKITIPHQLGKYWLYNPPHTPNISPSNKTEGLWELYDRPYLSWFLVISLY